MHSFGGFIRFVSRPCRDVGLSRHCEDFVLLYCVMQGLVPVGTLSSNDTIIIKRSFFDFPKKKCIFAFLFYCCAREAPGTART